MRYVRRCNVLIASPSDVAAERDQVFRTIATWNGNADRPIVFVPLMWEKHAISDADRAPQAAIDEQLLNRADLLLAIFGSRLGTPTHDYPAGTIEELSRRTGKAAVFFREISQLDMDAADLAERLDQVQKLAAFQKSFGGFARKYTGATDLSEKVRDQLDGWANQLDDERSLPLVAWPAPWTFDGIVRFLGSQDKPLNLLFYNVELPTFRSPDVFAERWAFVNRFACVQRLVFLLPEYKIDRLRRLLPALVSGGQEKLLQRFHVCPQKDGSLPGSSRERVSSSLAFVTGCYGSDVNAGDFIPIADLAILSEPFASADYRDGSPDLQWEYNYFLSVDAEAILVPLRRLWREQYEASREVEMLSLLTRPAQAEDVERGLERIKQTASARTLKNEETYNLISQLRAKLFDPNVPSYLLNDVFELLDWNPAFELIFPTSRFYRNMSVKEFVECLDNRDEVKRHGLELADSALPVDMEQLLYTSPVYGKMRFTKIASRVVDPIKEETCGWIVALNVNHVEHWQVYEDDLKRTNEEQSLISLYALAADRILGKFPGYAQLVDAHVQGVHAARNVLDLGSGPGFLAAKLLAAGVAVTSIDINDAMMEITRRRCGGYPSFSAVKANVEKLHAPNEFYDVTKVGIGRLYDAACMLNIYQWLHDPAAVLRRLVEDELLSPGAPITISLLSGEREVEDLFKALNDLKGLQQTRRVAGSETSDLWEQGDFERFASVMKQFITRHIAGRYSSDDVRTHLTAAGYRIVESRRVGYAIGDRRFEGFPFFVAEAPRG